MIITAKRSRLERLKSLRDRQLERWFMANGVRKTQLLVRILDIDSAMEQENNTPSQAGICIPPASSMGVRMIG